MASANVAAPAIPIVGKVIFLMRMGPVTDVLQVPDPVARLIPNLPPEQKTDLTLIVHGNVTYPVVAFRDEDGGVFLDQEGWKALLDAEGWESEDEIAFSASPNALSFHAALI